MNSTLENPILSMLCPGPMDVDERPPVLQTVTYGLQHALAMFSGTVFIRKCYKSFESRLKTEFSN